MSLAFPVLARPPLRDSVQVAVIMLYQGESTVLKPPLPGELLWVPKAKMPYSADLYLRSSRKINAGHPAVLNAMRAVRKQAVGHTGPSAFFDNPRDTMKAVSAWIEQSIEWEDGSAAALRQATQWSNLWPSAAKTVQRKKGDAVARTRLACALMRAFKVPARPSWFRGEPAVQYWVQPLSKKKQKKKSPLGYWILNHERYAGEAVDSYALKVGDFDWVEWEPAQEMSVRPLALQQSYYPMHLSAAAKADFDYAKKYGRLPLAKTGSALPPDPPANGKGSTPYLRLVRIAYELTADGALQALSPLRILVPYLDHQDYNLEAPPASPRFLKIKDTAVWSNRPSRLTRKKGRDYYGQYLPAMGYYHRVGVRLRKAETLLSARVEEGVLQGRVLHSGNLAPDPEVVVTVRVLDDAQETLEFKPGPQGFFELKLSSKILDKAWLKVSAGRTSRPQSRWDTLVLPLVKRAPTGL